MPPFNFLDNIKNTLAQRFNPEGSPDNPSTPLGLGNSAAAPHLHVPRDGQPGMAGMIPPQAPTGADPSMMPSSQVPPPAPPQDAGAPPAPGGPPSAPAGGLNITLADLINLGLGTYLSGLMNMQAPGQGPAPMAAPQEMGAGPLPPGGPNA